MDTLPPLGQTLTVGSDAPAFGLPDQDNQLFLNPMQNGKWLVIYFFPKALTTGCTLQSQTMASVHATWRERGVETIGISPDTVKRQQTFAVTHALPQRLLADTEHTVSHLYGVWQQKSMYGRTHMGVQRRTFIIAPDGRIAHIIDKVSPKTHTSDVHTWFTTRTSITLPLLRS